MISPSPDPLETVDLAVAMAGLSKHTQRAYLAHIKAYLASAHDLHVSQIDIHRLSTEFARAAVMPVILRNYLGTQKQRGLGRHTLTQMRSAVVWLAALLVDLQRANQELVGAMKRVPVPAAETGQRTLKWLTAEEVKKLIQAVPHMKKITPAAISRNLCIITLIAATGLRREEVSTALWSDLIKMGGHWTLRVHGKGERVRPVKLPGLVLESLNAWQDRHPLPDGDRPIFTQLWKGGVVTTAGLSPKAIWEIVEAAASAAGIADISPHVLRRSFARGAFEQGASFELIRQTLGHQNIQTTERYVNATLELDRAATDAVAEALEDD